ncbi:hypothetical protein U1Q18_008741 [Sarracenia purpurea var. burkii]
MIKNSQLISWFSTTALLLPIFSAKTKFSNGFSLLQINPKETNPLATRLASSATLIASTSTPSGYLPTGSWVLFWPTNAAPSPKSLFLLRFKDWSELENPFTVISSFLLFDLIEEENPKNFLRSSQKTNVDPSLCPRAHYRCLEFFSQSHFEALKNLPPEIVCDFTRKRRAHCLVFQPKLAPKPTACS